MFQLSQPTLDALRCPKLAQPLKVLNEEGWAQLSARLSSHEVETAFGGIVTMEGAAICADESPESASYAYPISAGLIYLMPTDAVHLTPSPSSTDEAEEADEAGEADEADEAES